MTTISSQPRQETTEARVFRSSYVMSRKELRRAAAAKERFRFSLTTRIVMKIISAPLAFICICGLIILFRTPTHEFTQMFMAMYGIFLIISLVVLFHTTLFVMIQSIRPDLKKLVGKQFDSDISSNGVTTDAFGVNALMPWKGFQKSGITRHGLFLCLHSGAFHWIPADSFSSEEDWKAVKDIACRRLPKRK